MHEARPRAAHDGAGDGPQPANRAVGPHGGAGAQPCGELRRSGARRKYAWHPGRCVGSARTHARSVASLAEIEELEEEFVDFGAELSCSFVPFAVDEKEDDAAPPSWKLSRVPPGLATELEAYMKYRTDPFVRARDGTAAQDITVGNDRATVLRSVPPPRCCPFTCPSVQCI